MNLQARNLEYSDNITKNQIFIVEKNRTIRMIEEHSDIDSKDIIEISFDLRDFQNGYFCREYMDLFAAGLQKAEDLYRHQARYQERAPSGR